MHSILWIAFAGYAFSQLITKCRDDNHYFISLPYTTNNSQILSATAGSCDENSTEVAGLQDFSAGRYNVTIDIERCGLNTETYSHPKVAKKALYMANVTNLKLGRRGNGMDYVYLDMNIATECGRQMQYTVTHTYGSIATSTLPVGPNDTDTDSSTHVLPGALEKFEFKFLEFTNASFNAELNATEKRQAGTKAFLAIEAQNMNPDEYTFTVPDCMVKTSTNKSQALFSKVGEKNSFIDLLTRYRTIGQKQQFLLSHIFFVLDRSTSATYSLTCTVKVCPKNFMGDKCSVLQSCSSNPCVHGTCTDSMTWQTNANKTDYTCACDANYEGANCDKQIFTSSDVALSKFANGTYEQKMLILGRSQVEWVRTFGDVAYAAAEKIYEVDLNTYTITPHTTGGSGHRYCIDMNEDYLVYSTSGDRKMYLLHRKNMTQIASWKPGSDTIRTCRIENNLVATGSYDGFVRVYDITDKKTPTLKLNSKVSENHIMDVEITESHIIAGRGRGRGETKIWVFDKFNYTLLQEWGAHAHSHDIKSVNRLDDKHYITTGNQGYLKVWEYGSQTPKAVRNTGDRSWSMVHKDLVYAGVMHGGYTATQYGYQVQVWDFSSFPATVPTAASSVIRTLIPVCSECNMSGIAATDTAVAVIGMQRRNNNIYEGVMNIIKLK